MSANTKKPTKKARGAKRLSKLVANGRIRASREADAIHDKDWRKRIRVRRVGDNKLGMEDGK